MAKLTEAQTKEMERILAAQADPDRASPMVEKWEYLDRRAALEEQ